MKLFLYGLLLMTVLIYRPTGLLAPTTPPEQVWSDVKAAGVAAGTGALTLLQRGKDAIQNPTVKKPTEQSDDSAADDKP